MASLIVLCLLTSPSIIDDPTFSMQFTPAQGDTTFWIINDELVYSNEDISSSSFIVIEPTGRLVLQNSELSFTRVGDGILGIRIMPGGELVIQNSTVDSIRNYQWNLTAMPSSSLVIFNSTITGYPIVQHYPASSLVHIDNASCSIIHSTFRISPNNLVDLMNLTRIEFHNNILKDASGNGLHISNCEHLKISNITMSYCNGDAMQIEFSTNLSLAYIDMTWTGSLLLRNSESISLVSVNIMDSQDRDMIALDIMESDFLTISNLSIPDDGYNHIQIQRSHVISINNSFIDTTNMNFYMSTHLYINRNIIITSQPFLYVTFAGTSHNIIAHNIFYAPISYHASDSYNNSFDYGGYGNYWVSYEGEDLNNDSIGDTPYSQGLDLVDNYPLMNDTFPPLITIAGIPTRNDNTMDSIPLDTNSLENVPPNSNIQSISTMTITWFAIISIEVIAMFVILYRRKSQVEIIPV